MSQAPSRVVRRSIERPISEVQHQLDQNLSFGTPPTHTSIGQRGDNGVLAHMRGKWVRQQFVDLNTAVVFQHNLDVTLSPTPGAGRTNVLWIPLYLEHDGTGAGVLSAISLAHTRGDTMTTNSIALRCHATNRTVDASHPIHVVLFFMPAE